MSEPQPTSNGHAGTNTLMLHLYDEVRKLAHDRLRHQRSGMRMQTTEVVHEVYIKLSRAGGAGWESRAHFFGSAARAMKQVLIDFARRSHRARIAGQNPEELPAGDSMEPDLFPDSGASLGVRFEGKEYSFSLQELAMRLQELDEIDPRRVDVVVCKFFAGMSEDQIASFLGVSTRTVQRDWQYARAWLGQHILGSAHDHGS